MKWPGSSFAGLGGEARSVIANIANIVNIRLHRSRSELRRTPMLTFTVFALMPASRTLNFNFGNFGIVGNVDTFGNSRLLNVFRPISSLRSAMV